MFEYILEFIVYIIFEVIIGGIIYLISKNKRAFIVGLISVGLIVISIMWIN